MIIHRQLQAPSQSVISRLAILSCLIWIVGAVGCGRGEDPDLAAILLRIENAGRRGRQDLSPEARELRRNGDRWTVDVLDRTSQRPWAAEWEVHSYCLEAGWFEDGDWPPENCGSTPVQGSKETLSTVVVGWFCQALVDSYQGTAHSRFHVAASAKGYLEQRRPFLRWRPELAAWELDWNAWKAMEGASIRSRLRSIVEGASTEGERRAASALVDQVLLPALDANSLADARTMIGTRLAALENPPRFGAALASVVSEAPIELVHELIRHSIARDFECAASLTMLLGRDEVFAAVERGLLEQRFVVPDAVRSWLSGDAQALTPVDLERRLGLMVGLVNADWKGRDACLKMDCQSSVEDLRRHFAAVQREFVDRDWRVDPKDGRPYPVKPSNSR